jgi:hypothetical protein
MKRLFAACSGIALATALAVPAVAQEVDGEALRRDVTVLSSDEMEGREAGTRGHERAAGYVAGRLAALGIGGGAGGGSYFQEVPMLRIDGDPEATSLSIDGLAALDRLDDYVLTGTAQQESGTVEAELVFVGYGLDLPDRDDLAGVDLNGKIAVRAYGGPRSLNSEEAAHYRSTIGQRLSDRGAIGMLLIWTPLVEGVQGWDQVVEGARRPSAMTWVAADGQPYSTAPGLLFSGSLSAETARALMAGHAFDYDDLIAAEQTDAALVPAFPLGRTARVIFASTFTRITTPNVIGHIPGTDPVLKDEYVVLTAHLDHLGIAQTEAEGDDEVYNGAMDNAVGVASMIDVARMLKEHGPRRSVLVVAVTAEDKGLLGSGYNAANPTVPAGSVVANVNLDMPILSYPFSDVVAFGSDHSTLATPVSAAAAEFGLTFSPDPAPEQGFFVRSDQYSYVRQGIPAVNLDLGWASGGQAAQEEFLDQHYHRVSDEVGLVDFTQLERFTAVNYAIARNVADLPQRPVWNPGDFFGETFGLNRSSTSATGD